MSVTVVGLNVYPIKGCRGIALESAIVEARGLQFDRRWMLVHADTGGFLSQRSHPEMARIAVMVDDEGALTVTCEDRMLVVPRQVDGALPRRGVSVWSFAGDALDCGDEAGVFFRAIFRFPVRLVRVPEDFTRRVKPEFAVTADDGTGFADGFPILVATEPSLADLNKRLAVPVPMNRFRPNIVVNGDLSAWAEHAWATVRCGEALLHAVKPCDRCAVTTIDQETGAKTGAEPLATLATFRRDPQTGKVYFGVNLIPNAAFSGSRITVGDVVTT